MKKKEPKPAPEEKSLTDKGLHAPAYSVSEKVRKRRRNKKIASIVMAASFSGLALMAIIATLTDRRCWLFWCEVCAMSSVAATVVLKTLVA